ncbi:ureidoglycolate dehydrogenase (NAD+) [Devosia enhydra]|uniref:Ureidoglycolate dehydrogenase (NAD+) n=1 Tax=Devosia enhydra TaxID=665118 RepID=A0A1K2HZU0_9HYPH|nr:Ldh family oxidoreductase [Devosia enhydra]SFZ85661.1 ureidoglycolate dehydrogenase (NAD+) [Devosia enhydra]
MPLLTEDRMHRLVAETLVAGGLSPEEARVSADASVFADLRGAATHGIVYIVRRTLESIRDGKTVSGAKMQIVRDGGATALVKGAGVVGPVLGVEAMKLAMERARVSGTGIVNTFNGNPIGLLGYYAHLAAEEGMIGLVMANTAPAAAPHGATSMVLGTNPFAYATPSATSRPILFDIATTVASYGKLQAAKRRGSPLPEDWLIDAEGKPITDPKRADEGAMLPCGGHKGSGLGILIHLLTGGLSGTTVGGEDTHGHPDPEKRGQGALFMAIDPEWFGSRAVFEAMVEAQIGYIHAARPLPGREHALYPGERGWSETDKRQEAGIPVADEDWAVVLKAIRGARLDEASLLAGIA